ncbi:DUF3785 family protein [Tepidibacter formicigenes]|jgi:hypothetical protein|nr:DUF3785 family protein [Tepidibacter formicigenes]
MQREKDIQAQLYVSIIVCENCGDYSIEIEQCDV